MARSSISSSDDWESNNFKPASLYKRIRKSCKCLSTGIFAVDMAISEIDDEGYAGLRERDVIEWCGPNNSLKSAAGIAMIVATQKRFPGRSVAAIFSEAFDPDRLEACGVDLERLYTYVVYDEETDKLNMTLAEKALNAALHLVRNPEVMYLLIDSVAALTPKGLEFDGSKEREFGKPTVALLAKVFNEFVVKFKNHSARCVLGMINHYKQKIDTNDYNIIQEDRSKLETPGGRGSEFLSDVRILCTSTVEMQKEPHSVLGIKQGEYYNCRWNLFKNKYCPTVIHRTVKGKFDPTTSRFNNTETLIEWGSFFTVETEKEVYKSLLSEVLLKKASWYRCGDIKAQGADKLALELDKSKPELVDKLMKEMYKLESQFFEDRKPSLEELLEQ